MRKKLISKTYLRDIDKYKLDIYYDKDNYYLSIKKIIHTNTPFILPNGVRLIDNDFYIVEVIPKNENYTMRVYFNKQKERVGYYFDISLENGVDEESNIPYYSDLYLDVAITNGDIEVLDADELEDALKNKVITKKQYDLANNVKDNLLESIKNNNNIFMHLDLESYLL